MPIAQNYIFNKAEAFTELASALDIKTLEELRKVTNRLTENPDLEFEKRIRDFADEEAEKWYKKASTWINANLAAVYLRAINMQDAELSAMVSNPKNQGNPIPLARFGRHARITGETSAKAKEILSAYKNHWDSYTRYEATFKEAMNKIRLPFSNSSVQTYREIAKLKMKPDFVNGSVATRKDLAQGVINEFADRGINVIDFPNRRMSVEAFAEREARSYLQDTAVQGQINRATERGYDLVRINSYAGPSPMCAPHQGHVYSLSGNSEQYPPLSDAIFDGSYSYGGGIYHDYSFSMDTKVFTRDGWKHISHCQIGEQVLSYNPKLEEFEFVRAADTQQYESDAMVQLVGETDIRVTPDHTMYHNINGWKLSEAQELVGYDCMFKTDGSCGTDRIFAVAKLIEEPEMVCCLTLEKNHLMLVKRDSTPIIAGNCGHFQSTYLPGLSESVPITDSPEEQQILDAMGESQGNRYIYEKRQELRDMEYRVRTYQRRKAASLTASERRRNNELISAWRGRIDQHLDEFDFLKQSRL